MVEIISFPNLRHTHRHKIDLRQEQFEREIYTSFLSLNLETTSYRFLQPGITNLYKSHVNPVECWFYELRHTMTFYNDSTRHRWIIDLFQQDDFRVNLTTACEIDMHEIYQKCEYWAERAIESKLQLNSTFKYPKQFMGKLEKWRNCFNSVLIWSESDSFKYEDFVITR